jgi:Terpene cyclase DEP1
MKPKTMYLALCVIGTILPYWQFASWLRQHGLNLSLFIQELFANRIGAFFGIDVIVSAIVLIYFARLEGSRIGLGRWWLAVIAVLTVGVSLGLPLFLYLRELKIEQNEMMNIRS